MPKRYPKKAREVAVALYLEGLSVPEITRRFNDGTAGLIDKEGKPQPIGIKKRTVAEYVAAHKAERGPRPEPEDQELTVDSINRVKQRALNVLAREIAHLEQLPKGRISAKQSTALRQHYATLDDMERRQEIAEKRRGRGKRRATKAPASDKAESAIEALAKAEKGDGDHLDVETTVHEGVIDLEELDEAGRVQALRKLEGVHPTRGLSKEELDEIMGSARP